MSYLNRRVSERADVYCSGWSASGNGLDSPSPRFNVLKGIVTTRTIGLTRTTLRIRIGERTDLRIRWQAASPPLHTANIGETVHLTIPAEAIHLEAGGFRRGKQRWNRWIGRVVLVVRNDEAPVTTVKLHRDNITLNSVGPVIGAQAPLIVWDTVNIVIDPQQVSLAPVRRPYSQVMPAFPPSSSFVDSHPSRVWLRATIRSVQSVPAGLLVTLNVGAVNLYAVIELSPVNLSRWRVGASVEISIDRPDAQLRQFAEGPLIPCSIVHMSENGVPQHSIPIHRTYI